MSSFLTLESVSLRTQDGRFLFSDLSLSIARERIGLVGRNGCGKSSLLHLLASGAPPAEGSVVRQGTFGLLEQDWDPARSLADVLCLVQPLARLERIVAGEGCPEDFEAADWTLEERLGEALRTVGLAGIDLAREVASLSGGERTRLGLARLHLERPDLLLLDEPTNNLDAEGRALIGELMARWPGGVLVASHDRALLEGVDRVVELSPVGIRTVTGGWSAFEAERTAQRAAVERELVRSEETWRTVRRAVQAHKEAKQGRDRAGRAFAARGSEPKILLGRQAERAENSTGRLGRIAERQTHEAQARLERAREQVEVTVPVRLDLPPSGLATGSTVLALDEVEFKRGGRRFGPWSLTLKGPQRLAVTGPNGAGKSTLLALACGALEPTRGTVLRAEGRIARFDQHLGHLDPAVDVLVNYRRLHPQVEEEAARSALARLGFRNRAALQRVGSLSGGERLRAGLASTLGGDEVPWLLVLDEPTNHLDIEAIERLEEALVAYDGALLVVSHDRRFLKAIGIEHEIALTGA
ncbi:ABC-F family ATP-binding cassette domain-containing protein [Novosphingobium profundi]|uniref:ABC-F family ATP-binding cassette domain-containing protein n=1 Tax=Novosphingobium profundi TaxID=1774954 RepID=UPI001BDB0972|nr:ABC-F family ATP-binding cassette domain-containing protein [Novosphingobium profundi]MBT0667901.1 ABC-F family ATP-binding cassette domain-containing protein [Novosphingobium profundi]